MHVSRLASTWLGQPETVLLTCRRAQQKTDDTCSLTEQKTNLFCTRAVLNKLTRSRAEQKTVLNVLWLASNSDWSRIKSLNYNLLYNLEKPYFYGHLVPKRCGYYKTVILISLQIKRIPIFMVTRLASKWQGCGANRALL